ncbi:tRNA (guanosine(46)-N7)-methyltransferase TrmB [Nocardioides mesophilus]|uniref:tRNA (guanine-N(7)-)-methyltransferase n=1 Tax=Nocardioides mesophilus TaxID=433659 RepID=A0A7G9R717_9ACTN|nr:tRNA (guanosine(46)-N7)-methyltransferase TrmB [Nocardioides mesophilus]QNN51392.1 tRNA (guanosine(46)-N7)-methyltransferase TrmB [Nocardioides mesophilus]
MQQGVRPARPHTGVTEDGQRIREVLTYSRRGSRLSDAQAEVWGRRAERWWIPDEAVDEPGFSFADRFGRDAPLIVEIGSGIGEATAALAARRPAYDVLAFEVWRPGVAETFHALERAGVENVRMISVDAVWSLENLFAAESIAELWTFFPDPWPKKRHEQRRLVGPAFAAVAASRLQAGGVWRLATDWPPYAEQMQHVLDAEPLLEGGPVPRWTDRPHTRFERRGLRAGRPITDLAYRRREVVA